MKITKLILFIVVILLVFSIQLFKSNYYVAKTGLNVRTGPGKIYPISFVLDKNHEVKLLDKEGKWCRIEFNGNTGYVNSSFLYFSKSKSDINWNLVHGAILNLLTITIISTLLYYCFIYLLKLKNKKLIEKVTHSGRGTASERRLVLKLLKHGMSENYIFHDLLIKNIDGEFSQTDVAIITNVGIIIVEVKDYSGWIYGSGNKSDWYKTLAYGKNKYTFYNPIKQNNKHIEDIKKQLTQYPDIPYFSLIVFYGNCVLKNLKYIPENTFIVKSTRVSDVINDILSENSPYQYSDIEMVINVLNNAVTNGGIIENQKKHKNRIVDMLGSDRIYN
jgi:hypothetical protein